MIDEIALISFRYGPMFLLVAVGSHVFLVLRKTTQRMKKQISKQHQMKLQISKEIEMSNDNAEENVKISFNSQAYNPEVIDTKIFVIISALTMSIMIAVAVFVSFRESEDGRFPIMQFLVRFILSVIIPLIIYFNNSSLITFVGDMIFQKMRF